MSKCEFCEFYDWLKDNKLADKLETALVQRSKNGPGRTTNYFPDLRFCPSCGKRLDGDDHG